MTHAPAPLRPRRAPGAAWRTRLLAELRTVLADTYALDAADPPRVDGRLHLLGAGPVATAAQARARVDGLAAALVGHMDRAGWDPGAAPGAVTSVLAASVPAAEAALLRVARRSARAHRLAHRAAAR